MPFDSAATSTYYTYKYGAIRVDVRVFENESTAAQAFFKARRFLKIHRMDSPAYYKYGLLDSKSGDYIIYKGKATYAFFKECKHPETYYEAYKTQMQQELYGKTVPDSCIMNIRCGG